MSDELPVNDLDPNVLLVADPEPEVTAPAGQPTAQDLINMKIATALERLAERQDAGPIPQIPITKAIHKTATNPTGGPRPVLKRAFYQNGNPVRPVNLTNREIELINQLKAGAYHNSRWYVTVENVGDGQQRVHVQVPNKAQEDKLAVARLVGNRGFEAILELMVEEGTRITAA